MKYFLIIASILVVAALPWHYTVAESKPIAALQPVVKNGGYPDFWATAPKDSMADSWGMPNRECASYVAFRIYKAYGFNLNRSWGANWLEEAKARGIPVDTMPSVGSVIWQGSATDSHVMWVDSYDQEKNVVHISEYNARGSGKYHEADFTPGTLQFIHFDQVTDFKQIPLVD